MVPLDTSMRAQKFQWNVYAQMGIEERFRLTSGICRGLSVEGKVGTMTERDLESFLFGIVDRFDTIGIDYMIVGSVATGIWAAPRYTQDVDVVVDADQDQAAALQKAFDSTYYVGDRVSASADIDMDNIIHPGSGWKVDLIWKKGSAWDAEAFERKVKVVVGGRSVWVISAEDLVIAKLLWAVMSGSEMQLRDVANIVGVADLDWNYLSRWIDALALRAELERATAGLK